MRGSGAPFNAIAPSGPDVAIVPKDSEQSVPIAETICALERPACGFDWLRSGRALTACVLVCVSAGSRCRRNAVSRPVTCRPDRPIKIETVHDEGRGTVDREEMSGARMVDLILSQLAPHAPRNVDEVGRISGAWDEWSAGQLRGLCSELVILLINMGMAWRDESGSLDGPLGSVRRAPPVVEATEEQVQSRRRRLRSTRNRWLSR